LCALIAVAMQFVLHCGSCTCNSSLALQAVVRRSYRLVLAAVKIVDQQEGHFEIDRLFGRHYAWLAG
jgi:hypothetical protein